MEKSETSPRFFYKTAEKIEKLPKYLYHGTSSSALKEIRKTGFLYPRKKIAGIGKGNFGNMPSAENNVYLTSVYAPYFAMCATKDDDKAVVLRIDTEKLDQESFIADEDAIEQAARGKEQISQKEMVQRTKTAIAKAHYLAFKKIFTAVDSLNTLGNCAYSGAIKTDAINDLVVLNTNKVVLFWDPVISKVNYLVCGQKYKELSDALFSGSDPELNEKLETKLEKI